MKTVRDASRNLLPSDSSSKDGLCFQLYTVRLARMLDMSMEKLAPSLPERCEEWRYQPGGAEWSGVRGFIQKREEVARLLALFKHHSAGRQE